MPCAARAPNCCVCARWPARASSGRAGTPSWRNTSHTALRRTLQGEAQLAARSAGRDLRHSDRTRRGASARAARGRERLMLLADVTAQRATLLRVRWRWPPAGVDARPRPCRVARALPQTIDRLAEDESRLRHALTGAEDALTRADNQQRDLASQLAPSPQQVRFPRANHSTQYANAAMRSGACCVAASSMATKDRHARGAHSTPIIRRRRHSDAQWSAATDRRCAGRRFRTRRQERRWRTIRGGRRRDGRCEARLRCGARGCRWLAVGLA